MSLEIVLLAVFRVDSLYNALDVECCVSFLFHTAISKYSACLNCFTLRLPCNEAA